IKPGDKMFAFIKKIREDSKIDLVLQEQGYGKVEDFSFDLEEYLLEHKSLNLHDKSDPNDIRDKFGVSKKIFKKAIGKLYKEGIIEITPDGIKLKIKNIV
ncbi:MAG: GntR family transcriptional regulator, partial [Saprospiraceae bacterium]